MNALKLWEELSSQYPERSKRVQDTLLSISGSSHQLTEKLGELERNASIANGRAGYIGNPYEQIFEDLSVLRCAADKLLGKFTAHPQP